MYFMGNFISAYQAARNTFAEVIKTKHVNEMRGTESRRKVMVFAGLSHHNSSHLGESQRNIPTYCRGIWAGYAMSAMMYKVGLELAGCKSMCQLVWYSRRSLPPKKAHVEQEMQVREKDCFLLCLFFFFFSPILVHGSMRTLN